MALHRSSIVRNRLLSALPAEDFAVIEAELERVALPVGTILVVPNRPIEHVVFVESGIVSTIANTEEGRIEVGVIGREGVVGVAVALGTDRTPHTFMVQGAGEGLRIGSEALRRAIAGCPAIFRPLGLFVHTLTIQLGQTAYANVSFNIEARLARWILMTQDRVGGDEVLLTHDFLSAMLGVRRPGVTSATHVLEGSGSIRNRRGRIQIVDRDRLLELAGDTYGLAESEYARVMTEGGDPCRQGG